MLAAHYLSAHQAAPEGAEGEAVAVQAKLALRGAADRARALGSHEQVLVYLDQARSVATDPIERTDLLEQMGVAADAMGRFEAAEAILRETVDDRRQIGDRPAIARTIVTLASSMISAYHIAEAQAILQAAEQEFANAPDDPAYVGIVAQLARGHYLASEDAAAVAVADRAIASADRHDIMDVVADLLVTKGGALCSVNREIEGLALLRAGLDLALREGMNLTALRAYVNLTVFLVWIDPAEGFAAARAGMDLATRIGNRSQWIVLAANGSEIAQRTGDWDWWRRSLAELADIDVEAADRFSFLGSRLVLDSLTGASVGEGLAEIAGIFEAQDEAMTVGELERVKAWLAFIDGEYRSAIELAIASGDHYSSNVIGGRQLAGRAALWSGDERTAASCLSQVLELSRRGTAIEVGCTNLRAGVDALGGRRLEAMAGYRSAMARWQDLGLEFDRALCGMDAVILLGPGDPEVDAMGEEARSILTRLGAAPLLARLEAAMGAAPQVDPATSPAGRAAVGEEASTAV